MRFRYDPAKAAANLRKHKVSFADAEGVFKDPLALTVEDPDAKGEQRFVARARKRGGASGGGVFGARGRVPPDIGAPRDTQRAGAV